MVVAKVLPEWAGQLPTGVSSASGVPHLDVRLRELGVRSVERLHPHAVVRPDLPRLDLVVELHPEAGVAPSEVVRALAGHPTLEWVEAVQVPVPAEIPDDPQYGSQHHLPQIEGPDAWDHQKGDSAVVVAIVDNGTDYLHPDLWDNVFTNEAEASGTAGVDDDGNGYVDDVHGYDVADEDADPSPAPPDPDGWYDHGTLTAGAAAAVTNNGLGVAAVSWNCEYMPVKGSYDTSPQYISRGYTGITYAAETGADIISCSWGSFGDYSQYNQDVVDYATGLGSMVVASAGNDPTGIAHYPSAYFDVVSVTWVNPSDVRASSATWGRTVDVSAPGVGIRSTRPGGGYGDASGSSLAAPIAAGLAGLIKSGKPELGPTDLARQLVLTTDNIDALNPGYEGLLGTGRINALRAVTEEELVEQPYVETWSYALTDSPPGGNGDGLLEQGETAALWLTYRSFTVSPAMDATITLDSPSPGVTILEGISDEGDIPADTIATASQALTFMIEPTCPSQLSTLLATYQAAGGLWQQDTFTVSIGRAPVLFVDDDDGEVNVEDYYLTVLDSLGLPRLVWDQAAQGEPDTCALLRFPVVIWACEWAFPSLTEGNREAIGQYLDAGGSVFMSGQDIGWSLCDEGSQYYSPEAKAWYEQYLHAEYVSDDSEIQSVEGIPGDPVGGDLAFGIYQPGRDPDNQYPSVVTPTGDGAAAVFRYQPGVDAAVRYRNDHGVVYMAFGFEAVESGQNLDPIDHTGTRTELMGRIMDYLGPIQHEPLSDTEDAASAFPVTATMQSPGAPDSLWLAWSFDLQAGFELQAMVPQGDGSFAGSIPAPPGPSDVWYYLEATCPSYTWTLPLRGTYRFYAGPDTAPPTLRSLTQLSPSIQIEVPREVTVLASDGLGLDLEAGSLHYAANGEEGSLALTLDAWVGDEARMRGELPAVGSLGDTVFYWCSILDTATTPNTGYSDTLWYVYGLDDFETGSDGWDTGTGWGLASGGNTHSGEYVITDSPQGQYGNNEDNQLTYVGGLDLANESSAFLSFWALYALEDNEDFCHIDASRDGSDWTTLLSLTGREVVYTNYSVSLEGFVGEGADSVLVRFRLLSDEEGVDAGVFLDDVLVSTVATPADDPMAEVPGSLTLRVGPNPARGAVHLRLGRPTSTDTRLRIYDIAGRRVRTLVVEPGQSAVLWDARDGAGRLLPPGMYHVNVEGAPVQEKLILVR
jgi:subtilisin family serine protease